VCHNFLRTLRQKWPLRRIRNRKVRNQKAPQNKTKQTSYTVHMQFIPSYATSPSSRAVLYCPSQFIVSPPHSFNSCPVACRLLPFLCISLSCRVHLCDRNMEQNRAHSIHLIFLRSSENNITTYVHQQTALH